MASKPGGELVALRTKPEQNREAAAPEVRQAVLELPVPDRLKRPILHHLDALQLEDEAWPFMLIGTAQQERLLLHLTTHSARPLVAVRVYAVVSTNVSRPDGDILLGRAAIAARAGVTPNDVTKAMAELEELGIIRRLRTKETGGGARVLYRMNPWVATKLANPERKAAQASAEPPQLGLRLVKADRE